MKPPRPLSRREAEVARLAAQRTKDDAIALLCRAGEIYRECGCDSIATAFAHMADNLGEHLHTASVVTEL